jgi:hypothetical protein
MIAAVFMLEGKVYLVLKNGDIVRVVENGIQPVGWTLEHVVTIR